MLKLSRGEKTLAFAGVLIVLFLASLNLTVIGTALPRIIAELNGFELYAWAFTAFSLASTVSLPIFGQLSDIYGRKPVLLLGIVLFAVSSALGGVAGDMPQLIAARVLQGVGGGALMSMSFATIADIFTPRERGKYQGFTGAVFGISSVIGPLVGGFITDELSWRWVFFVNLPVAIVAFYVIARNLPAGQRRHGMTVDYFGSLLLAAGIVPLLLALSWGGVTYAWTSVPVLVLLASSLFLLIGFTLWQLRASTPILEPDLFRNRTFSITNLAGALTGAALFGAIIYLPLFVQGVQGGSAAASGFALTPLMLGLIVSSTTAGLFVSKTGRYKSLILAGLGVMVVSFYLSSTMDRATLAWLTSLYMVLLGLGIGPTTSLYVLAVQNALPVDKLGVVTSANQFFRQISGTIGVAVFGAIMTSSVRDALQEGFPEELEGLPQQTLQDLASPNLLTDPAALDEARQQVEGAVGLGSFENLIENLRAALASGLSNRQAVQLQAGFTAVLALAVIKQVSLAAGVEARLTRLYMPSGDLIVHLQRKRSLLEGARVASWLSGGFREGFLLEVRFSTRRGSQETSCRRRFLRGLKDRLLAVLEQPHPVPNVLGVLELAGNAEVSAEERGGEFSDEFLNRVLGRALPAHLASQPAAVPGGVRQLMQRRRVVRTGLRVAALVRQDDQQSTGLEHAARGRGRELKGNDVGMKHDIWSSKKGAERSFCPCGLPA